MNILDFTLADAVLRGVLVERQEFVVASVSGVAWGDGTFCANLDVLECSVTKIRRWHLQVDPVRIHKSGVGAVKSESLVLFFEEALVKLLANFVHKDGNFLDSWQRLFHS